MAKHPVFIYNIRLITCAVSFVGFLTLCLAGLLAWEVLTLIAGLHVLVYFYLFSRPMPVILVIVLMTALSAFESGRIFFGGRPEVLPALRDMIVCLALARLLMRKTSREIYQIIGISLAECILATVFTISPLFLIGITLEALLIPIILNQLDLTQFQGEPQRLPGAWHWFMIFGSIVFTGGLLFFLLPRPASTLLSFGLTQEHRTGFSEEVDLTRSQTLSQDRNVVMRIIWSRGTAPKSFYLSGARLEGLGRFGFMRVPGQVDPPRQYPLASDRLTIYPSGLDSRNVFFSFTFITAVPNTFERQGEIYYWKSAPPAFYDVLLTRTQAFSPVNINAQFPDELASLKRLARTIAPRGQTIDKVKQIQNYLGRNCRYSLEGLQVPADEMPIETFLRERKGACEHFASALAAMLRAVDVPARLVTGFLVTEFNMTGQYFIVRSSDAHAWVEYWDQGRWYIADPTPQALRPVMRTSLIDALRFRWIRWVVEYSIQDQINMAEYMRVKVPHLTMRLTGIKPLLLILGIMLAAALIYYIRPAGRTTLYTKVLRAFAAKGLHVDGHAPHETHLAQVKDQWPEVAPDFERFLEHYLAWRFGQGDVDMPSIQAQFILAIRKTHFMPRRSAKDAPAGQTGNPL